MDESDDILAAQYALGVLDIAGIVDCEDRILADPGFAAKVAWFDQIFYAAHGSSESNDRADQLWDRIERAVDDRIKSPETRTVRVDEMGWEPYAPLITRKVVHLDRQAEVLTAFYRLEPGAEVISHTHLLTEECLVVEGEIECDGIVVRAGEVHLAPPGSHHVLKCPKGAMVYLRGDLNIQL